MVAEVLGPEADDAAARDASLRSAPVGLLVRFVLGAVFSMNVMVLSLAISSGYGVDDLHTHAARIGLLHWIMLGLTVPALGLLAPPVVASAFNDLRARRLTLNTLFVLGTAAAVGASLVSYVQGFGPTYLETACMLLTLYTLGRYLDARAKGETALILGRLLSVPPTPVVRLEPDPGEVSPDDVRVGDRLRIRPGDVFPADGDVVGGASFVDESSLTGESRPVVKGVGSLAFAGTGNLDGALELRVTAVGHDRRLARIEALIQQAISQPTRSIRLAESILRYLVPGIAILAVATFIGWYWAADFGMALRAALSVVLISCPCALGLATPIVLLVAITQAAKHGILIRSGETLEQLAGVRSFLFDKTGTLSQPGTLAGVTAVWPLGDRSADEMLRLAASVEATVRHPLAEPIVRSARSRGLDPLPVLSTRIVGGQGIVGVVETNGGAVEVAVGNAALMASLGASGAESPVAIQSAETAGHLILHVAVDRQPAAALVIEEQVDDRAAEVTGRLREAGYHVAILSGDRTAAAERMGDRLGVTARGELAPGDKVQAMAEARAAHGPVAMVGDGLNDAAVIAHADVGITFATGAGLNLEVADVTLFNPDLRGIVKVRQLAERSRRKIRQNLGWSFGYNGIGLLFAVSGLLHPFFSVIAMVLSSLFVTANAFSLARSNWADLPDDRSAAGPVPPNGPYI